MNYNIIATGSSGNCILLNGEIALDMGIPFKQVKPYYKGLKMVFISHIHSDHLRKETIKRLAYERPTLLFCVGEFLVEPLLSLGVKPKNIIIVDDKEKIINSKKIYLKVKAEALVHDVPNYAFKITYNDKKVFYATDTAEIKHITARNYDLYLIEGNYTLDDINERIARKKENNEYIHEFRTIKTHLSVEKASEWLLENMSDNSEFEFIHQHKER